MIKRLLILPLLLMSLIDMAQPIEKACFSVPGGFYEASPTLEIVPFYPQHHIRFTTNGNRPTAQSRLYTGPLLLDESLYSNSAIHTIQVAPEKDMHYPDSVAHCIVIRAAVFDAEEHCLSEVATNSYFIQSLGCNTHGLPVLSLCADSLDLFGYYNGIMVPGAWFSPNLVDWTGNYFCKGLAWEKPCNVEFYEQDNTGVNQIAGLRTHGGASRRFQQKGLKVYAKEEYGKKRFEHVFFPENTPLDSYKHLCLKPFRCSNWMTTGIQDQFAQQVARALDVDGLASRQMVLYLNGEYWGIYALEESPDERYLEDHFDVGLDESNIIKQWFILEHGNDAQWNELFQWVKETDLSIEENYNHLCEQIDIDNFIDYQIFELYSGNVDWPKNNVRCWQPNHGKWRWVFYDGDGCFFRDWDVFANAVDTSSVTIGNNPSAFQATLFFRKMMENQTFKERFSTRFQQLLTHSWQYEQLSPLFQANCDQIRGEVPSQCDRFGFPSSLEKWEEDVDRVDGFLRALNPAIEQKLSCFLNTPDIPDHNPSLCCYPNPFDDRLTLKLVSEFPKTSDLSVFNLLGQEVLHEQVRLDAGENAISIHLSVLPGVYLIKMDQYLAKLVRR